MSMSHLDGADSLLTGPVPSLPSSDSSVPPKKIVSEDKGIAYRDGEPSEAKVARIVSIASLFFLQPWFTIPAILLAFKRGKPRKLYMKSIWLSLAAAVLGLGLVMSLIGYYVATKMPPSRQCQLSELPSLQHGTVLSGVNQSSIIVGSNLPIVCDDGYGLVGHRKQITCEQSGNWAQEANCAEKIVLQQKLGQAAADGDVAGVKLLLGCGCLDVNWRDDSINMKIFGICGNRIKDATALHRATSCNVTTTAEVVRLLIDAGADVNITESIRNYTALMMAANNDHLETVSLLLDRNAYVDPIDTSGSTPLMWAASYGHLEIVKLLLDRNADVSSKNIHGGTALIWAARKGHLETVRLLLDRNAYIESKDNDGKTALMMAVENGHLETVKLLLDRNADRNSTTKDGNTALMYAASHGRLETVKLLLDHNADINAKNIHGSTALIRAANNGRLEIVKLLLDLNADINSTTSYGLTALIAAAEYGHLETVKLLLDRNADINPKDNEGNTALILAARNGKLETVKLLSDRKADVNSTNSDGNTALIWAARNGYLETVRLLLDRKADINAKNKYGETALIRAADNGHVETVRLLLDHNADINSKDNDGWTALIWAASHNKPEVAKLLLERGADRDIKDIHHGRDYNYIRNVYCSKCPPLEIPH